jgi:hypothetical protein
MKTMSKAALHKAAIMAGFHCIDYPDRREYCVPPGDELRALTEFAAACLPLETRTENGTMRAVSAFTDEEMRRIMNGLNARAEQG